MTESKENDYIIEVDDENDFIIEGDDELTTYSYINNGLCFEYFVGFQIASLLGYKNTRNVIIQSVSKSNKIEFRDFPGVKIPELDPRTILISHDGAIEILIKTRKRISPDVLYILKKFKIETTNRKCLTKEQQTLSSIGNAFKTEAFEDQFKVGKYYLDLYFTEYKIAVECDENGHSDRKPHKERERMDFVNETLGIDDSCWIRFNPDEHDFDMSKVIGRIYRRMEELKEQKYLKLLSEREETDIEESKTTEEEKKEEPLWELQIEEITGKFTAPPKEYLIEKLKTHNISDIAKSYGISTNPVSKWLKKYEINIKDYHNYDAPPKEDLIKHAEKMSQTEIANHYKTSPHIVRKWLKHYDLDIVKLRSSIKPITKEELIELRNNNTEEKIAEKLNISLLNLQKLLKTHSIYKMPNKEELEKKLYEINKDDLAKEYNTCRTTLRKWIKSYGLEDIRCQVSQNSIKVCTISESNNEKRVFENIKDLCKEIHIGKKTFYKYVNQDTYYKGIKFQYIKEEEDD